eukprot:Pompholyxophrys_sp_v1_NODE_242_length_1005_cov_1.223158.p2 type:complete len:159 gc:universal NODE_242_length_1005_cov_1.223158:570-94(-)
MTQTFTSGNSACRIFWLLRSSMTTSMTIHRVRMILTTTRTWQNGLAVTAEHRESSDSHSQSSTSKPLESASPLKRCSKQSPMCSSAIPRSMSCSSNAGCSSQRSPRPKTSCPTSTGLRPRPPPSSQWTRLFPNAWLLWSFCADCLLGTTTSSVLSTHS